MGSKRRLIDASELELEYIKRNGAISLEMIGNIPTVDVAVPHWISVVDGLPEDDENVLVYALGDNGDTIIAMSSYTHHMHGCNIEGWRSPWQYFFYEYKITHWMSLPSAPKEKDHED